MSRLYVHKYIYTNNINKQYGVFERDKSKDGTLQGSLCLDRRTYSSIPDKQMANI